MTRRGMQGALKSKRSLKLLALTISLGVAMGLAGALLRPASHPDTNENNVVFRGKQQSLGISKDELQRRLLERLVRQANRDEAIQQHPDFQTFQRIFLEQEKARVPILERLVSDDSPGSLRLAFATALPSRPRTVRALAFRSLIVPLLASQDTQLALAAAEALDHADFLEAKSSPACRCRFAHLRLPADAQHSWWIAWSLDQSSGLRWAPEPLSDPQDGWSLGLQADIKNEAKRILVQRVDSPLLPGQKLAVDGLPGAHFVVKRVN